MVSLKCRFKRICIVQGLIAEDSIKKEWTHFTDSSKAETSSVSSETESVDDVWTINDELRKYYLDQFLTMQPDVNGVISGDFLLVTNCCELMLKRDCCCLLCCCHGCLFCRVCRQRIFWKIQTSYCSTVQDLVRNLTCCVSVSTTLSYCFDWYHLCQSWIDIAGSYPTSIRMVP